ncbi:MAG: hypothetical protein FWH57_03610 [Oscillospiraceae bacterium]|nr:hypothetical protein [Oscillospiraceae bacterium]
MKKRIISAFVALVVMAAIPTTVTRATIAPYFMAVNDNLLSFETDTMPYISNGEFFVPVKVMEGLGVFSFGSNVSEFVRLYRGVRRYVDFFTATGITVDQDGNTLNWPSAKRIGDRFYVPLRQSCNYFSMTYDIIEVPNDIISREKMLIIRIISSASLNNPTFVSLNKNALQAGYNEYYASDTPLPPPPVDDISSLPPVEETPPDYSSITIYLNFFDISAENAGGILDLLDIQADMGYHSCFFVNSDDIHKNPGLIRRISGSGHMIGIMLTEGTYEEYLETSQLLFEAAKIKTLLVSAYESVLDDRTVMEEKGLILWKCPQDIADHETRSADDVIVTIPTENDARRNLMFSCSEGTASMLPGIISFLIDNNYTIGKVTETVTPLIFTV